MLFLPVAAMLIGSLLLGRTLGRLRTEALRCIDAVDQLQGLMSRASGDVRAARCLLERMEGSPLVHPLARLGAPRRVASTR